MSTELSLIIAMIFSIIFFATVFFILGCVCGQLWQKHKQPINQSEAEHTSSATDNNIIPTEQDQLEMMELMVHKNVRPPTRNKGINVG